MERRWLLGGLLIASGVGLAAVAGRRRALIGEDSRVLLFGDSLAAGLDPHMRQLAAEEGVAYEGSGIVGSRIDQWPDNPWLARTLADFRPTVVLISLGTNDAAMGPGAAERQRADARELVEMSEVDGAAVVWIGPPTLPFDANEIRQMLRSEAPYYFDSEDYTIPRGPDELHPTAAGYAGWAGALWRWLT